MRPRVLLALSAGVATAILAYAALAPGGLPRLRALDEERAALQAETSALAAENARLEERARVLRGEDETSRAVLEKVAREELGMVKEDEILVVLPTGTPSAPQPPPASAPPQAAHGASSSEAAPR